MGIYDQLSQLDRQPPTASGAMRPITGNEKSTPVSARDATQKPTRKKEPSSGLSSDKSREKPRGRSRKETREQPLDLPTRNEIQEFSFRLRDELKVKVQAEVPHSWQRELAELARQLDVKKLELYRFVLGEFLGKVKRKKPE